VRRKTRQRVLAEKQTLQAVEGNELRVQLTALYLSLIVKTEVKYEVSVKVKMESRYLCYSDGLLYKSLV
jgi:hypothetical protein